MTYPGSRRIVPGAFHSQRSALRRDGGGTTFLRASAYAVDLLLLSLVDGIEQIEKTIDALCNAFNHQIARGFDGITHQVEAR